METTSGKRIRIPQKTLWLSNTWCDRALRSMLTQLDLLKFWQGNTAFDLAGSEGLNGRRHESRQHQASSGSLHLSRWSVYLLPKQLDEQVAKLHQVRQITFLHSVRRLPSLLSPQLGWVLKQSRRTHLRSIVGGSMFGFTQDGMYPLR